MTSDLIQWTQPEPGIWTGDRGAYLISEHAGGYWYPAEDEDGEPYLTLAGAQNAAQVDKDRAHRGSVVMEAGE